MEERKRCEKTMKQNGLKATKGRKAVLDILLKSSQPITAEDIYLKLKKVKQTINLSTVYRTLESLEQIKMVSRITLPDNGRMFFEYNRMGHRHYLICVDCKKIVAIENCPIATYEKELEGETDFQILGHKLYLYGYCKECQEKRSMNQNTKSYCK